MTNREKLAAVVAENAERILVKGALNVEALNAKACECSPIYPDGCEGGHCMSCFKAYLDTPAADDFEFEDEFLFPPDAAFILIKEAGADDEP